MIQVTITGQQTIHYNQTVEMEETDYEKLTGKNTIEDEEKASIIDSYLNKMDIHDWESFELEDIEKLEFD
nr:hypothetical protein [Desulfobacula sp.]